jgi:hypothetical protein
LIAGKSGERYGLPIIQEQLNCLGGEIGSDGGVRDSEFRFACCVVGNLVRLINELNTFFRQVWLRVGQREFIDTATI